MATTSDPEHLTGDVLRLGVVAAVDPGGATCMVESGGVVAGPLPWVAWRAGGLRVWAPPSVGEQCLVLSPEGDLGNGIVLPGLYCDAFPAPSDQPDLVCFAFADGAWIGYDPVRHALAVTLPAGGTAALDAPGGLTIHGDVTVNGSLTASGDVGEGFPSRGTGIPACRAAAARPGAGLMAGMARDTGPRSMASTIFASRLPTFSRRPWARALGAATMARWCPS
jgi:phage baseplate assembly protein V